MEGHQSGKLSASPSYFLQYGFDCKLSAILLRVIYFLIYFRSMNEI